MLSASEIKMVRASQMHTKVDPRPLRLLLYHPNVQRFFTSNKIQPGFFTNQKIAGTKCLSGCASQYLAL